MTGYKATPEQWEADRYDWSKAGSEAMTGDSAFRCILELRARVEALEAQGNHIGDINKMVPPPVATDEELGETWDTAPGGTSVASRRAIYNHGIEHGQAGSREVAEPAPVAGGLVERVKSAIDSVSLDEEARAAILEVARWMQQQGWQAAGEWLEVEAGR
jgi:hypothetical protein